jgi:hypothetical protein
LQVSAVPQLAAPTHSSPVWHLPPPQIPPLPHSEFAVQALAVQVAPEQTLVEPVPQSAFVTQGATVHFALLHSTPLGHCESLAQIAVLLHLAPLHSLLSEQALSPAQLTVAHLAPLHVLFAPQLASSPQLFALHVAPLQTEPCDVQAASLEHANVPLLHVAPLQEALDVQD